MDKLFNKNRLDITSLLSTSIEYIVDKFKQSRQLFSVTSAYGQILFVVHNIAELILFYIEDSIVELSIFDATRASSVYGLARLAGHNPTRSVSSSGELKLLQKTNTGIDIGGGVVIIPNYTKIKCNNNGITYLLDLSNDEMRIPIDGKSSANVNIKQGIIETQNFTGTGLEMQSFEVPFKTGQLIDNFHVKVFINGEEWKQYESFYDIPKDSKSVMVKTGISSGIDIIFGNGYQGLMPPLGSNITVEYLITNGTLGNIDTADLNSLGFRWEETGFDLFGNDIDLNTIFSVKCNINPDFGSDPESLDVTRVVAPKTSKSLVFANTDSYVSYFTKFNSYSLVHSWTTVLSGNVKDDNIIYLMLVPDIKKKLSAGESYFNVDLSRFLLNDIQKNKILRTIEDTQAKLATTEVILVDPVISKFVINITLILFEQVEESLIRNQINSKIAEYFMTTKRRDRLPKSDLIALIEGIDGIDSVSVTIISEIDEMLISKNPNTTPIIIDEFGDILLTDNEIPVVKGGWSDRFGTNYEPGISTDNLGAVNIAVRGRTKRSHNTDLDSLIRTNLRK
jgi:hypothetical protein